MENPGLQSVAATPRGKAINEEDIMACAIGRTPGGTECVACPTWGEGGKIQ